MGSLLGILGMPCRRLPSRGARKHPIIVACSPISFFISFSLVLVLLFCLCCFLLFTLSLDSCCSFVLFFLVTCLIPLHHVNQHFDSFFHYKNIVAEAQHLELATCMTFTHCPELMNSVRK